jgi:hypothetical protein
MKAIKICLFLLTICCLSYAQKAQINLWYGKKIGQEIHLNFGQTGVPQRWVNILGNIEHSDSTLTLSYQLNDGASQKLVIGPDERRLEFKGDFNVEIHVKNLKIGKNLVEINLRKDDRIVDNKRVIVNYNPQRNLLKEKMVIHWGKKTIEETAQVVDGKWVLENGMVRSKYQAYDRIIAIGDTAWTNYEIKVPVIIHSQDTRFSNPAGGASLGLLMRWKGHVAWNEKQPREGWWPYGAVIWYGYEPIAQGINLILQGNEGKDLDKPLLKKWEFGKKYWLKLQGITTSNGHEYKAKFWDFDKPEPAKWDVSGKEPLKEFEAGSMLFVNHYTDASFGDVEIRRVR